MTELSPQSLAALVGLMAGLILGLAARLGDLCTLYALETAVFARDQRRLRLWGIAGGTAILTSFLAEALGFVDLSATAQLATRFNPLAAIFGGLIFGYGMALSGNCGFGALVRCGAGDLRSLLIVAVLAIAAMATASGALSPLGNLFHRAGTALHPQGFAHLIGRQTGFSAFAVALPVGAGLIGWALSHPPLRHAYHQISWAIAAGLATAGCLIGTTVVDQNSFGTLPPQGPDFALTLGLGLTWVMQAAVSGPDLATGLCAGVLAGAMAGSALRHTFHRRDAESAPRRLGYQIVGAALMGTGGVIAGGDAAGQGLTGMATLSYAAPLALLSMIAGALIGLHQLMGRVARG
ncbi:MAG: YeeE/YedE family protein [Paracoccaceae bacterium]